MQPKRAAKSGDARRPNEEASTRTMTALTLTKFVNSQLTSGVIVGIDKAIRERGSLVASEITPQYHFRLQLAHKH
jgi:hypothetical protein